MLSGCMVFVINLFLRCNILLSRRNILVQLYSSRSRGSGPKMHINILLFLCHGEVYIDELDCLLIKEPAACLHGSEFVIVYMK